MLLEITTKDLGLYGSITLPIDAGYPGRQYLSSDGKIWLYIKKISNNTHLLGDDINDVINNVDIDHANTL